MENEFYIDIFKEKLVFIKASGEKIMFTEEEIKALKKKGNDFLRIKRATKKKADLKCSYCEKSLKYNLDFSYEHIIPKSLGGKKTVLTCKKCNQVKSGDNPFDYCNIIDRMLAFNKSEIIVFRNVSFNRKYLQNISKNIKSFLSLQEFENDVKNMKALLKELKR